MNPEVKIVPGYNFSTGVYYSIVWCPVCKSPFLKTGVRGRYVCANPACPRYNVIGTLKNLHGGLTRSMRQEYLDNTRA